MEPGKILALGPQGTNGHQAASMLKPDSKVEFCEHNSDILRGVHEGRAPFGIVPIENSISGRIHEVIKFWMSLPSGYRNISVIGGIDLPVSHCLLVHPEIKQVGQLKTVFSHPEAVEQCQESLRQLKLIGQPAKSTADAAKIVAESDPRQGLGAIASEFAANLYGLKIMRRNFQDENHNSTRFHLIGRKKIGRPSGNDLTPIIFWLKNEPGELCDALTAFKIADINMTSIHSIPLGHKKYAFYVEIQGHQDDKIVASDLTLLKNLADRLIILGSYKA
jgi:chorismate mutase / prephenate dehydratase